MNEDLKYLNENGYFDVPGFMHFLSEQFPEPMKCTFTQIVIMNILNDAAAEYNYDVGQFITRIVSMIPEITWDDVIEYADALMVANP